MGVCMLWFSFGFFPVLFFMPKFVLLASWMCLPGTMTSFGAETI